MAAGDLHPWLPEAAPLLRWGGLFLLVLDHNYVRRVAIVGGLVVTGDSSWLAGAVPTDRPRCSEVGCGNAGASEAEDAIEFMLTGDKGYENYTNVIALKDCRTSYTVNQVDSY